MDNALRSAAMYELAHPRASVVHAIASLDLQAGMHVADVGCSTGIHLGLLAAAIWPGGSVTGFDIDRERLAVARDVHADAIEAGGVRVQEGDFEYLPARSGEFDLTWSSLVLHHAAQPATVVAELARVTRSGGRVAVLEGDNNASFPFLPLESDLELRLRAAMQAGEQDGHGGRQTFTFGDTARRLIGLFQAANLANVELRVYADVVTAPLDAHTDAEIRAWAHAVFGPRVRPYLAADDWDAFCAAFTRGSATDLPTRSDFFQVRSWFLVTGQVP